MREKYQINESDEIQRLIISSIGNFEMRGISLDAAGLLKVKCREKLLIC